MLGPVVLGLSLVAGHLRSEQKVSAAGSQRTGLRFLDLVPWFIVGFLLAATMRSLGLIPAEWLPALARGATVLTTISMAALGLGVDVRVVAQAGLRVTAAVTASLLLLGLMSLALIFAIGFP